MVLRIQRERQTDAFFPSMREYAVQYGLHLSHLNLAASDAIVMHPGPMNRGIEIASEIADGGRSLILDQVTNGVAVRMAVLYLLAGAGHDGNGVSSDGSMIDVESESRAAGGGFTTGCAMPNTNPVNDNAAVTRFVIEQAERAGLANVFPIGAITKNSEGTELAEMGDMKDAGIVAVSDDGRPVPTAGIMRRAMEYARGFDLPIIDHCEEKSLAGGGVMHEGHWSLVLGLRGLPAAAEEVDAERDCLLAELTGARMHLAHVSTRGAIDAVRRAKEKGLPVTCEAAQHHWTLTDEAVAG